MSLATVIPTRQTIFTTAMPRNTDAQKDIESLAILLWNAGTQSAFNFYKSYVCQGDIGREMTVSWGIEALAFPGLAWAELFEMICNDNAD